jgi:uncharacterized membrane protein
MSVFLLIFLFLGLLHLAAKLGFSPIKNLKDNARIATGITFVFTGISHFIMPDKFMMMMPPFLPFPLLLIYVSGFFEILGGMGLIIPKTKRAAAFGLVLLLIAVFPANIYVALNNTQLGGYMNYQLYQWVRLPLQIALILWVLWFARRNTSTSRN